MRTSAVGPQSLVGMGRRGMFRSITVSIWLYWDLGSLEAGSKPLALCHVLWAIIDWCLLSGRAHHAGEGQNNGDGGPAIGDDTVRRSAWLTLNVKVAWLLEVNHDSGLSTMTFILLSVYTLSWLKRVFSTYHYLVKPGHQMSTNMELWLHLVCEDLIKYKNLCQALSLQWNLTVVTTWTAHFYA